MADYGSRVADKAVATIEKKIHGIYRQAARELQGTLGDFQRKHKAKDEQKRALVEQGLMSESEYQSWLRGQVFMEKQWKDKIDQATRIMNNANEEAVSVIRDGAVNVFAENYNHAAYELESDIGMDMGFNLYSPETVAQLIEDDPQILPEWKVDEKKDYIWNEKKARTSVTQGIIQGDGVDDIANRLMNDLCSANENKMRTFARTSVTDAQNSGRMEMLRDAEDEGIKVKKKWLATLDDRTRDTHRDLDGQVQEVDDPFVVDDMEIMFPGDPQADPCLVFNCRCTLTYVYEGIDQKSVRRDGEGNLVENMTYREWEAMKEEQQGNKGFTGTEGQVMISGGVTGAKKTPGWEERHAKVYYEEVRNREPYSDARRIAQYVPMSEEEIETVRNHVFVEEHDINGEIKRFDEDKDQADAWQRLGDGKGTEEDYIFLQHELAESQYMKDGYSQEEAHRMANEKYNWWELVEKRKKGK